MRSDRTILFVVRNLYCHRGIVKQDPLLVDVGNLVMLTEEQRSETRTVNKQIAFEFATVRSTQGTNILIDRTVDRRHVINDMSHAQLARTMPLQQISKFPGVQVVSIVCHCGILGCFHLLGCKIPGAQMPLDANGVYKRHLVSLLLPVRHQA